LVYDLFHLTKVRKIFDELLLLVVKYRNELR